MTTPSVYSRVVDFFTQTSLEDNKIKWAKITRLALFMIAVLVAAGLVIILTNVGIINLGVSFVYTGSLSSILEYSGAYFLLVGALIAIAIFSVKRYRILKKIECEFNAKEVSIAKDFPLIKEKIAVEKLPSVSGWEVAAKISDKNEVIETNPKVSSSFLIPDIIEFIFSFLSQNDLVQVALVSKNWMVLSSKRNLWAPYLTKKFAISNDYKKTETNGRKIYLIEKFEQSKQDYNKKTKTAAWDFLKQAQDDFILI